MLFLRCAVVNLLLSLRLAEGAAIDAQHQEIMDTARDHSIVLTDGVSTFAYEQPNDNSSEDSFNTLTFDDIDLTGNGQENLTAYSFLDFSTFKVVNVTYAAQQELIDFRDMDCASSAPNSLFGERVFGEAWPRFVSNSTALQVANLSEYFSFRALSIKPVGWSTPHLTRIQINAYEVEDGHYKNVSSVYMFFGGQGIHPSIHVDMQKLFGPHWGNRTNMVEAFGATRDGKDWPFCIDDLEVAFRPSEG